MKIICVFFADAQQDRISVPDLEEKEQQWEEIIQKQLKV